MVINSIPNLLVAASVTKPGQPQNLKPQLPSVTQKPVAAVDSDGDYDGSGINIKA